MPHVRFSTDFFVHDAENVALAMVGLRFVHQISGGFRSGHIIGLGTLLNLESKIAAKQHALTPEYLSVSR